MDPEVVAWVRFMRELGEEDRDLYRQLRAEAWELVRRRHERMTSDERMQWERSAS